MLLSSTSSFKSVEPRPSSLPPVRLLQRRRSLVGRERWKRGTRQGDAVWFVQKRADFHLSTNGVASS